MEVARLPIRACLRYGWETFKKRPWFVVGTGLLVFFLNFLIPAPQDGQPLPTLLTLFGISFILGTFLQLGVTNLSLRLHDGIESARFKDLWRPELFLPYLAATVIATVLVLLGLILLIIPGIIIGLALSFATYLVVDRGLGPVAAVKESWRLTSGNRWRLFLFVLLIVLMNIGGLLLVVVGLLVTMPVSMIASVHAYRFLEDAQRMPASGAVPEASET